MYDHIKEREAANDRVLSLRQMAATRSITPADRRSMRNLKLTCSASRDAVITVLGAKKFAPVEERIARVFSGQDRFG